MRVRTITDDLREGRLPQGYELQAGDVGRPLDGPAFGWGDVLPVDVGKRVWRRPWGLCMENNEQRDARKAGAA